MGSFIKLEHSIESFLNVGWQTAADQRISRQPIFTVFLRACDPLESIYFHDDIVLDARLAKVVFAAANTNPLLELVHLLADTALEGVRVEFFLNHPNYPR